MPCEHDFTQYGENCQYMLKSHGEFSCPDNCIFYDEELVMGDTIHPRHLNIYCPSSNVLKKREQWLNSH
jgi:hypothetical protein